MKVLVPELKSNWT